MWPFYWIAGEASAEPTYYPPPEFIGARCVKPPGNTGSTITALPPETCIDGDLLLLVAACTGNTPRMDDPDVGGWTILLDGYKGYGEGIGLENKIGSSRAILYWKWWEPGDSFTLPYVSGTNYSMACIYAFRGVDQGDPFGHFSPGWRDARANVSHTMAHHPANTPLVLYLHGNWDSTINYGRPEVWEELSTHFNSGANLRWRLLRFANSDGERLRAHNIFGSTTPRMEGQSGLGPGARPWRPIGVQWSSRDYRADVAGGQNDHFWFSPSGGAPIQLRCIETEVWLEAGKSYTYQEFYSVGPQGSFDIYYGWFEMESPSGVRHGAHVATSGGTPSNFYATEGAEKFPWVQGSSGNSNTLGNNHSWSAWRYDAVETGWHKVRVGMDPTNYWYNPFPNAREPLNQVKREGPASAGDHYIYWQSLTEGWGLNVLDPVGNGPISPGSGRFPFLDFGQLQQSPYTSNGFNCIYIELRSAGTSKTRTYNRTTPAQAFDGHMASDEFLCVSYTDANATSLMRRGNAAGLVYPAGDGLKFGTGIRGTSVAWTWRAEHRKLYFEAEIAPAAAVAITQDGLAPRVGLFHHTCEGPLADSSNVNSAAQNHGVAYAGNGQTYSGTVAGPVFGDMGFPTIIPRGTANKTPYLTRTSSVIGCAVDLDDQAVHFYVNGKYQGRVPFPYFWGGYSPYVLQHGANNLWAYARLITCGPFRYSIPPGFEAWDVDTPDWIAYIDGQRKFTVSPNPFVLVGYAAGPLGGYLVITPSDACEDPTIQVSWENGGAGITLTGANTTTPYLEATLASPGDTFTGTLRVLVQCGTYIDLIRAAAPIAYWRMQDTGGGFLRDYAQGDPYDPLEGVVLDVNDATIVQGIALAYPAVINDTGTAYSAWFQRALSGRARAALPDLTQSWSIEVWYWHYDYPSAREETLFSRLLSDGTANAISLRASYGEASPTPMITVRDSNGVSSTISSSVAGIVGIPQHLVSTYDHNAKVLTLYFQGAVVGQKSNVNACGTQELNGWLGGIQTSPGVFNAGFFNGFMSDVAVYEYAIPENEVVEHFRFGNGESADGQDIVYVPVTIKWWTPLEDLAQDTVAISDGVIKLRSGVITHTVSDSIITYDDDNGTSQRGPLLTRVMSDAVLLDDWEQSRKFPVAIDTLTISDGIIVDRARRVTLSDSLSVFDSATGARGGPNIIVIADDSIVVIDSRTAAYLTFDDSVELADDCIRVVYADASPITDDPTLIEFYDQTILMVIRRPIMEDSIGPSDDWFIGGQTSKIASESATLLMSDGVIRGVIEPDRTGQVWPTDEVIRTQRWRRVADDSLAVTDFAYAGQVVILAVTAEDSLSVNDSSRRVNEANDRIDTTDGVVLLWNHEPPAYDYVGGDLSDPANPGVSDGVVATVLRYYPLLTEASEILTTESSEDIMWEQPE